MRRASPPVPHSTSPERRVLSAAASPFRGWREVDVHPPGARVCWGARRCSHATGPALSGRRPARGERAASTILGRLFAIPAPAMRLLESPPGGCWCAAACTGCVVRVPLRRTETSRGPWLSEPSGGAMRGGEVPEPDDALRFSGPGLGGEGRWARPGPIRGIGPGPPKPACPRTHGPERVRPRCVASHTPQPLARVGVAARSARASDGSHGASMRTRPCTNFGMMCREPGPAVRGRLVSADGAATSCEGEGPVRLRGSALGPGPAGGGGPKGWAARVGRLALARASIKHAVQSEGKVSCVRSL